MARLGWLTGRRRDEEDFQDEIRSHLEIAADERVGRGADRDSARHSALKEFGNVTLTTEAARSIWIPLWMNHLGDLLRDARFALRQFRRQPRYWTVIGATLVIGVAASTNLFAIVDGILLKPLPYPAPDRLVVLATSNLPGEYVELQRRATTMDVAAYYPSPREVTLDLAGRPARLGAAGVTSDLFHVLGVGPIMGRGFSRDETRPDGPGIHGGEFWRTSGVVIISSGVWQEYFGGRRDVIGRTLQIENVPHTVVGVMPAGFNFPARDVALWFPHNIDPANLWSGNVASMIGRLRPGRTVEQARAELRALMPTFLPLIPWRRYLRDYGRGADVKPLVESMVGGARPVLLVLLAAIGVVLLVLCVNVANLLLARGVSRHAEMATRAALGASRWRLARQVMAESLVASLVAGAIGVLVSLASLRVLVRLLPADLPRIEEIGLDVRVVSFALAMSAAAGLAFGLLPAFRATTADRSLLIGNGGRVVIDARERHVSAVLATLQFSMAVVLATAAVLLLQSLSNLTGVDPGFRPERLVTARVAPPGFAQRDPAAKTSFAEQLLDTMRAMPGVDAAALASAIPFDQGQFGTVFRIAGRADPESAAGATLLGVTRGYFATMGTPIVEGREFTDADGMRSPRVAMVSDRTARRYWGSESPIGKRIRFTDQRQFMIGADGEEPFFTIVGVVGDTRFASLTAEVPAMLYVPLSHYWDVESLRVVLRTAGERTVTISGLQALVSRLEPATPVSDVRTFDSRLGDTLARARFAAYLLTVFAVVAVFLAAIGAYGVLSYALSRRVREIGVRLALGAGGREVFGLLFRHGMTLTLAGLAIGIPAAAASTRFLSALLFGVESADASVLAGVSAVLLLVGVCVSLVPARQAGRLDPMVVLRPE